MFRPERWLMALVVLLFLGAMGRDRFDHWVNTVDLPVLVSEVSSEIRDRNGALLRVYTINSGRWRLAVTPGAVDPQYIRMLIAYEDKRFYQHAGIDLRAMLRAAGQAVWRGSVHSGGSTLSMQVARLLEDGTTGRWQGKLRQIRVALALERVLDKSDILRIYLENAPFGGNIEGIRAATLAWFGKEPRRLTPAEAALLVALPQSPETRRPDRHHGAALVARERVLERMVTAGVLSESDVRAAKSEPVPSARIAFPMLAPHLSDLQRHARPMVTQHKLTLDADLQKSLEDLARNSLSSLPGEVSVAMMLADHRTGEVLAWVGSASYGEGGRRQGFVDMVQAHRSPGSTLKPLVYAMAFDRGLAHPQTLINDRPVAFGNYAPRNFDGTFRGELPVSQALKHSLNIPVVLLMDEIGPAHLMDLLRRCGVKAQLPGDHAGLAVALGGLGVTLRDLVQLYAMLANGGIRRDLYWDAEEIPDSGPVVLGRSAVWQVSDILASLPPPNGMAAGRIAYKTGTSYGHRDAWAVGYDGAHVAAVWIGRPDGTPLPGAYGGDLAAPVLFEVFQRAKPEPAPLPPPPPETLILSTARLPAPLKRFAGRNAVFEPAQDSPKLVFPPEGARLSLMQEGLTIKLRDGVPPFTLLANGTPVATGIHRREMILPDVSQGYSTVSVIDALGRAAKVTVWVQPADHGDSE